MLVLRGQAADYDGWAQLGCTGWSWEEVLPDFLRSEDHGPGADALHAQGGEWRIEEARVDWPILRAWEEACAQWGVPRTADFNRGDNEGVGRFLVNQRRGLRWSAARAFLRPVLTRPNLRLITRSTTERLEIAEGRARAVVFRRDGLNRAEAGQVILAAGAIGSPQILMLSGLGPGSHLAEQGIEVLRDCPEIGGNLQDHLQLRLTYRVVGAQTLNEQLRSPLAKMRMAAQYAWARSGPLSAAPSQMAAFLRSGPEVATPDLEFHVQPISLPKFGAPPDAEPGITTSVCQLRPDSRGTVRLAGPTAEAHPIIAPNYLSAETDRSKAVRAIRIAREIMAMPALAPHRPEETRPGAALTSELELRQAAGDIGTTIFHPVGTARMGPDPAAPCDPRLRVRGVDGLRVVDASIMPRITSGNTATPVVMIAEKAARMILEDDG